MTKPVIRVAELIAADADDVTRIALSLSSVQKVAAIREIATHFASFTEDIDRLKLLLFVQAALSSLTTRIVPVGTATAVIAQVQPVATGAHDKVPAPRRLAGSRIVVSQVASDHRHD